MTDVTDEEERRGETRPIDISRRSETLSEPYQIEIVISQNPQRLSSSSCALKVAGTAGAAGKGHFRVRDFAGVFVFAALSPVTDPRLCVRPRAKIAAEIVVLGGQNRQTPPVLAREK